MKKVTSIFSFFYRSFVLYTLTCYALLYWFPFNGWFWGFVMMSFPVVVIGHIIVLLFSLLSGGKKNVLLPVIMLLLAGIFLPRTFQLNGQVEIPEKKTFKVMNYNVHGFENDSKRGQQYMVENSNMKEWVTNRDVDILCMAEYVNYENSTANNVSGALKNKGFKYKKHFNEHKFNRPQSYWGMVLFSKYPIVAARDTMFEMQNGMIQADIQVGTDTVRVLSVHLYSMALRLNTLAKQRTAKGILHEGKTTARLIKQGFLGHARELEVVLSWVKSSPYPVIVCGDFNETPYGYVYGKTSSMLQSAFEEGGNGFGFTYNQIPYFIRIDHQFYDKTQLKLVNFETLNGIPFSDHYPLVGTYTVLK